MADFLQTLITAITLGALYALIALGYTMVYGILKLINFAHSDVVVLGAWSSLTIAAFLLPRMGQDLDHPAGWSAALVLIISMAVCALTGIAIERLAYKPIRNSPRLNALITAMGVSLFLQNAGQLQWNVIEGVTPVVSGKIVARGTDPKTILLDQPIALERSSHYLLKISPAGSNPIERKVTADPGEYAAQTPILTADPIGRAQVRDATFTLVSVSTPLNLPFGKMPARVPTLVSEDRPAFEHRFTSTFTRPDGTVQTVQKPLRISWVHLAIIGTSLILMLALDFLVFHTRLGTAMRAVSFNMQYAALMGIPIDRVITITFVIGALLAAAAGFLYGQMYGQLQQTAHYAWVLLGLKAFVAAVVGGIGNIRGAVLGGLLIAFIEQFGGFYGTYLFAGASAYTDVAVFVLLILVLILKPSGVLGSTAQEKV
ncbi:MAG: branched-chain amino acid ABC transporter permease [Burkholderiales bacterium]|nr:branched-chain amino acid ABC transporter permease [Phycisphaerae bacterium]